MGWKGGGRGNRWRPLPISFYYRFFFVFLQTLGKQEEWQVHIYYIIIIIITMDIIIIISVDDL